MKTFITTVLFSLAAATAMAQEAKTETATEQKTEAKPTMNIHGTIRSKYELQTEEGDTPLRGAQCSREHRRFTLTYYIL